MKAVMLKIVHTINHENLAGGTFWNGNFDILIVFTLWRLRVMFRSDLVPATGITGLQQPVPLVMEFSPKICKFVFQ